ncbi:hypothetical protein HYR54_10180 [Candidatus Acetothermia bacterium]|nr:hypothetical protein [Candidatus Acetothermia bacterium]MBI3661084.1 hypothetical protein [Candidatus Acetothermia bacterium]
MFSKSQYFVWAASLVVAFSVAGTAAPLSGSLTLDLVITPDCNRLTFTGPFAVGCSKVDGVFLKLEADLVVTLSLSGLDITSASTFTFKGLEAQVFHVVATLGALTARTTLVFAPSVTEIEIVRDSSTLAMRYCVAYQNPGDITPPFFDCPQVDSNLYFLIENAGIYHPIIQNLGLAFAYDSAGALDGPLYFVKKVVDINLNVVGLVLGVRALFGNLGTAQSPNFAMGTVLSLEGQTVSGVTVRAETWFGARQGLECLAECKPNERVYGGHLVSDFSIQEEKLFIRNLVVAGVSNTLRIEFQFFTQPGDAGPGLTYLEWNQRALLQPLRLSVSNTIRFNGQLDPRFDTLQVSYRMGALTSTAIFYIYQSLTNTWEAQLAEFINSFEASDITAVSDLTLCTETLFVSSCLSGTLEHDISISAAVANFTFDAQLILLGLISHFSEARFDLRYKLIPEVELANSYVIGLDALKALSFSFIWKF